MMGFSFVGGGGCATLISRLMLMDLPRLSSILRVAVFLTVEPSSS